MQHLPEWIEMILQGGVSMGVAEIVTAGMAALATVLAARYSYRGKKEVRESPDWGGFTDAQRVKIQDLEDRLHQLEEHNTKWKTLHEDCERRGRLLLVYMREVLEILVPATKDSIELPLPPDEIYDDLYPWVRTSLPPEGP